MADAALFSAALDGYDEAIAIVSKKKITQVELSEVMRWKLLRGKSRPKLQAFVDALPDATVRAASTAAFALASSGKIKAALEALSKPLKGVGPATASAILAAFDQRIPFMSDEALALLGGKPQYSLAEGADLAHLLGGLAQALQRTEPAASTRHWTAQGVQQAVWAAAHLPGFGSACISAASTRLLAVAGDAVPVKPKKRGGAGDKVADGKVAGARAGVSPLGNPQTRHPAQADDDAPPRAGPGVSGATGDAGRLAGKKRNR